MSRPARTAVGDAERMRKRAREWAAGAREAEEYERRRVAQMTPAERLAEAAELIRRAERFQAAVRASNKR